MKKDSHSSLLALEERAIFVTDLLWNPFTNQWLLRNNPEYSVLQNISENWVIGKVI